MIKPRTSSEVQWEEQFYRKDIAEHLFDVPDEWAKDYSVAELMDGAQLRRIPYAMVRLPEALVDDPQLKARGFFSEIAHPELSRTFHYPGGPFFFTVSPWRLARRPPLLGEHNMRSIKDNSGSTMTG